MLAESKHLHLHSSSLLTAWEGGWRGPSPWAAATTKKTQKSSQLVALDWPKPSHCNHLGSKPGHRALNISIYPSQSPSFSLPPFSVTLSNKKTLKKKNLFDIHAIFYDNNFLRMQCIMKYNFLHQNIFTHFNNLHSF